MCNANVGDAKLRLYTTALRRFNVVVVYSSEQVCGRAAGVVFSRARARNHRVNCQRAHSLRNRLFTLHTLTVTRRHRRWRCANVTEFGVRNRRNDACGSHA